METTTAPLAPVQGCEPDEDFATCEVCEVTKFDDWSRCEMSGDVTCGDCWHAEMREMERQCRGMYVPPTYEQLREDQAGFTSDDGEFWKLETLIARTF